jgi:hypothetical protein
MLLDNILEDVYNHPLDQLPYPKLDQPAESAKWACQKGDK